MGYCWYCQWGWSKQVVDIYAEAVRRLDGFRDPLHFGPSHVVWEDENFDCAQTCLDYWKEHPDMSKQFTEEQLAVVRWSLEELLKLPENVREPEPEAFFDAEDGNAEPINYPPPEGVIMIHMSYNTPLPGETHELQED